MLTKTSQPAGNADPGRDAVQYSDEELAIEFVREYYAILSQSPGLLHQFYKDESSLVYLEESDRASGNVSRGLESIRQSIERIGFNNCVITISSLDCLKSIAGSLLIMVVGDLNFGSSYRRFSQTFLLACQTEGFFILNDICRYFHYDASEIGKETANSHGNVVCIKDASPDVKTASPVNPSVGSAEAVGRPVRHGEASSSAVKLEGPNAIVAQPGIHALQRDKPAPVETSKPAEAGAITPKPLASSGTPTNSSWANLISQKDASQWGKFGNSQIVGQSVSVSPQPSSSPASASDDSSIHAMSNGKSKKGSSHLKRLFVQNITVEMEDSVLRKEFGRAGRVVDIQRHQTYAVVEYDSEEVAKRALAIDFHYDGKKLSVAPKRQHQKRSQKSSHSEHSHSEESPYY